jgi:hypothetical protein
MLGRQLSQELDAFTAPAEYDIPSMKHPPPSNDEPSVGPSAPPSVPLSCIVASFTPESDVDPESDSASALPSG